jgi:ribonucleoside-diphosphate reductase alpha subunit
MRVEKRSGQFEEVSFDKVIRRLKALCDEEPKLNNIDVIDIAKSVINEIFDGVKTSELDELAAEKCASMVTVHPDFHQLASRIIISNNQKNTSPSFSEVVTIAYNHKDHMGDPAPLVSKELYNVVMKHKRKLNDIIDYRRDFGFDYFAYKTLERAYLLSINRQPISRIQHMFLRVALGIWPDNMKKALKSYNLMSQRYFTHATPTLFNAGTPRPQLLSCFLLGMGDSISGIYKCLSDCAHISKWAGGIGIHASSIRAAGSKIYGTNGVSNGLTPMLKVFNETARYVDQCVTPETIIYTTEGPMEIQYCEAGKTQIFTTNGIEVIENVLEHSYEGEIYKINSLHSYTPLIITPEHPVYCLSGQRKGLNFSIIRKRLDKNVATHEWIDAKDLTCNDMLIFKIPDYEKDSPQITEDDCYMYGLLLGNGSMVNSSTTCYISLNSNTQKHVIEFVKTYLEQKCIKYFVNIQKEYNTRIRWNKNTILPFRYNMLYKINKEKYINERWVNLPLEKAKFIVKGLLHSDGSIGKELVFDSTSKYLIDGMRYICLRMGIPTGGYVRDRIGEKHTSKYGDVIENKKIRYCVRIPKTKELCELLSIEHGTFYKFFRHNGYIYSRISDITKEDYSGTLYDLQMNKTHNYMLSSGIVHNGGGKRKGSFAIYLEPWHADVEEFLDLKKNHGDENMRARDLFYAMWIPDLFMKRVKTGELWSLFCPNECRGLADLYGEEFETLYMKYEKEGKARKQISAQKLFISMAESQINTGTPYMLYKDNVNRKSNQNNLGTIKSSNLCCEIMEYSSSEEYACCTLASGCPARCVVNKDFSDVKEVLVYTKDNCDYCKLVKMLCKQHNLSLKEVNLTNNKEQFEKVKTQLKEKYGAEFKTYPQVLILNAGNDHGETDRLYTYIGGYTEFEEYTRPYFDFNKWVEVCTVMTDNLNRVIDINLYPVPETKLSNERHRPLGLGLQGLADTYALMRYPFDSPQAYQLNKDIFATMYYAAMTKSMELAKEEGPYSTFKGSPLSEGKFQFDLWDNAMPLSEVGNDTFGTKITLDWSTLRKNVMEYGARNSLLIAPMPTASTSNIMGNNECFEPFSNNVYVRRVLAGEFMMTNKYMFEDLINLNQWSPELKDTIIYHKGSIQNIESIPKVIRNLYKTNWDIPQKVVLEQARDRGIYVCQSQSMNLYKEKPTVQQLTSMHYAAWKMGLKTGMYYLRTKGGSKKKGRQQFTIDPKLKEKLEKEDQKRENMKQSKSNREDPTKSKSDIARIAEFEDDRDEACENCSA